MSSRWMPTGTSTAPGRAASTTSSHPARDPLPSNRTSAAHGGLPLRGPPPRHRVHRDGHRLREREGVGCQPPRRDILHRARRDAHELRESPVHLQSGRAIAAAQVGPPRTARLALTARDPGAAHHLRAERKIHALADGLDGPGELVTQHDRQMREHGTTGVLGGIRPAHPAPRHPDEDLAGTGGGHRPALDAQVPRPVEHGRPHDGHRAIPSGTSSCAAWRSSIIRDRWASYTAACAGESRYAASACSSSTRATTA